MKIYIIIAIAFYANLIVGQPYSLTTLNLEKRSSYTYLGTDEKYHFYSTYDKLYRISKTGFPQNESWIYYKYSRKGDGILGVDYANGSFYYVTYKSNYSNKKNYHYQMRIHKCNPITGEIQKELKIGTDEDKLVNYSFKFDKISSYIRISKDDEVIKKLDYDLKYTDESGMRQEDANSKLIKENSSGVIDFSEHRSRYSLWDLRAMLDTTQSIADKKYSIDYSLKSFTAGHFVSMLTDIEISLTGNKSDKVLFDIDNEKKIVEVSYKEDRDENLILFGKYVIKNEEYCHYGMFSTKFDKQLKQMGKVNYYPMLDTKIVEDQIQDKKYAGFFLTELSENRYEFQLKDNGFILVYQKELNDCSDHIYIMRIEDNGELGFHVIYNRQNYSISDMRFSFSKPIRFLAYMKNEKIYFAFYDHEKNLPKSMNEIDVQRCDVEKRGATAFVQCCYDINLNKLQNRQLVYKLSDCEYSPDLDYAMFYNAPGKDAYIYMIGYDGGNARHMYQVRLSNN